jgi:hypothetical protein
MRRARRGKTNSMFDKAGSRADQSSKASVEGGIRNPGRTAKVLVEVQAAQATQGDEIPPSGKI